MEDECMNSDHRSLIDQLERERDELRKDIEQLCLQQAGPSYLAVATRMHFQRTAGLEMEIETLKKKLAFSTRENKNLHEELSEVYHIKSQLADLHTVEVSKNMEAEKQLKFFQGCVAAAFAERDNALMEAEKAKEREDFLSREANAFQERIENMTSNFLEEKKLNASLQIDLMKLEEQNENLQKVISKFYDIRQSLLGVIEDTCLDEKCAHLLQDGPERWSFNNDMENPSMEYVITLEKELETLRNSIDRHQSKILVGLEIEDHLKQRVRELEKEKILFDAMIKNKILELQYSHTQHKCEVMDLLEHEMTQFKAIINVLQERIKQFDENRTRDFGRPQVEANIVDIECRDVHMTTDVDKYLEHEGKALASARGFSEGDTSDVLGQALREKVSALLLLSQQDERHLLERNVNAVLQKRMEELRRNLLQVTNEKVKALMELAQLRQDYQLLQENSSQRMKQGTSLLAECGDHEKDGKLKNLLKKTSLRHWIWKPDFGIIETGAHINNNAGNPNKKSNYPVDFARMKIENATLKEFMESMDHLTSSVHRLRLSLLKAKDSSTSSGSVTSTIAVLDGIITEAKLVRTALGSSLPVSSLAEVDTGPIDGCRVPNSEKLDSVSAAGFEMGICDDMSLDFYLVAYDDIGGITCRRVGDATEPFSGYSPVFWTPNTTFIESPFSPEEEYVYDSRIHLQPPGAANHIHEYSSNEVVLRILNINLSYDLVIPDLAGSSLNPRHVEGRIWLYANGTFGFGFLRNNFIIDLRHIALNCRLLDSVENCCKRYL